MPCVTYQLQDLRKQSIQFDSIEQSTQRISGGSNKDTDDTQTKVKTSAKQERFSVPHKRRKEDLVADAHALLEEKPS